jgi:hypothetical protein
MKEHLAVSMRASSAHARSFFSDLSLHGFGNVQLNALHHDFSSMSDSGRRDLASTLRRNELRASGVDFLALPSNWESEPEQTLMNFGAAVSISEALGRIPVSVCIPDNEEIVEAVVAAGLGTGILVAAHRCAPLSNPNIAWGLPTALLAKEERPMRTLAEASFGPLALRLSGEVVGRSALETNAETLDLTELRGVLDAMRWDPISVIDASPEQAVQIASAWHSAGPGQY